MKQKTTNTIVKLSNVGYIAACITLYLIALTILGSAVWSIIADMRSGSFTVYKLLDEVGLIVFSIAVIDVGKYLMIEEVLRKEGEKQSERQSRKALTKFTIIIASALSLEGLVLTIEVAKQDITQILYPVSVLLTGTLYIIGIALYQKLSSAAEMKE